MTLHAHIPIYRESLAWFYWNDSQYAPSYYKYQELL